VARESPLWHFVQEESRNWEKLKKMCRSFQNVGFESDAVSYRLYSELQATGIKLVPVTGLIEELRAVKDEKELSLLRAAAIIGDEVFDEIIEIIRPGISERAIANKIAYQLREKGCEKESFDIIVLSAENACLPHGHPGERLVAAGDMVTLDYGGFFHGYASDMTRTVAIGPVSGLLRKRYEAVQKAQEIGVAMVKAGIPCSEIDKSIRECLKEYTLDQYFLHGTGHGVGLEIHEKPTVNSRSQEVLQENMVTTIEPGIYIPGWGGIRIEDTVIVKKGNCEVITNSTKQLIII
jgi:Xaa-Pro aminopeptidase